MTTEQDLRQVLRRATGGLDPSVGDAFERLSAARGRQRRRRLVVTSLVAAAAVAAAIAVPLRWAGPSEDPAPGPASIAVGPLTPGRYQVTDGFDRGLTVTLGGDWSATVSEPGDVRLRPPATASTLVGLARVDRVFEPSGDGARTAAAPFDLPSWVKGHPDLTVVRSGGVEVAGLFGTRIVARVAARPVVPGECPTACSAIFDLAGGPVTAPAGGRLTLVILNDAGRFLTTYVAFEPTEAGPARAAYDDVIAGLDVDG